MIYLIQPWMVVGAAATLLFVATLPSMWRGVGFKRWYRHLLVLLLIGVGAVFALFLAIAQPLVTMGISVAVLIFSIIMLIREGERRKLDEENLQFLRAVQAAMADKKTPLEQALRNLAAGNDFPRVQAQLRQIISVAKSRSIPIHEAMRMVSESSANRQLWQQLASLLEVAYNSRLPAESQGEGVAMIVSVRQVLHEVQENIARDSLQIRIALYVLFLIVPGANLYFLLGPAKDMFVDFLSHPLGKAILFIEAATLLAVAVVFQILQKIEVPEW